MNPSALVGIHIGHLIAHYGILLAALVIFVTELGVPTGVPNEVVLLLTGAYAIQSGLALVVGVVLVWGADVLGCTALYWASRTGGLWLVDRVLAKMGRKPEAFFDRWRRRVGDRDILVVLIGRSLPLVRMTVAVGAGLLRIPADDFLIGVIPGGFFWAALPLILGYAFQGHVHQLIHAYHRFTYTTVMVGLPLLAIGVVGWLAYRRVGSRARAQSVKR